MDRHRSALRLVTLAAALAAVLATAAPAAAQQGPDAGQNEFFFHGPKGADPGFDSRPPTGSTGQTQDGSPLADDDVPEEDLAIYWTGPFQAGAVNKELVFRWFFSSPNAGGILVGVGVNIRIFALPATGSARIIGKVDNARLTVGATPTINQTVVPVNGTLNEGEKLSIQVAPRFIDTGPGLRAHYDSTSTPSGFSLRDPLPTSKNPGIDGLASAPAQGLEFSATVPADPQRDESEPNIEIDDDGNIYTCGPTGASQGADYAQVSTDGGNQFHLMGEPPRGQQAFGGGGDCGLATAPERNDQGKFNYAYTGLGPLTNFSTAASPDVGRTLRSSPIAESIPGVDRQWQTFLDKDSVLLSYNQQVPRQVVVQRADDGGVTYGPPRAATSTNPSFPGPMHSLPASQNPTGAQNGRVAYFGWNRSRQIFLAMSFNGGANWHNCKVVEAPGDPTLFVTVDNDRDGNIYVAYSERTTFHTYVSVLPITQIDSCRAAGSEVNPTSGLQTRSTTVQAAVNPPIQVDRDRVRTSMFSWVAAGGAPGRVAVAFYGSETDGDPNVGPGRDEDGRFTGFRGSWDVYVSQSLNALAADATFAQVKATTHPFHYDSICLNGLGCSVTGGDRSLADFFAADFNPRRHTLHVVYNQGYKRPDDPEGFVATPAVISQIAGPTLDGAQLEPAQGPALNNNSADPTGDALANFSRLCAPAPTPCPTPSSFGKNEPATDITSVRVGPEVDPTSGAAVENGGFTVTMNVANLSTASLTQALTDSRSSGLLFIFRWVNGFRSAAAVADYRPERGFTFGFNRFVTAGPSCGGSSTKCLTYPGDEPLRGKVDQQAGTITLSVPRRYLVALAGGTGADERPRAVNAGEGSRFYDGTAFSLGITSSSDTSEQSFLYPFDNAPSFDFLIAGALPPPAAAAVETPAEPAPGPATDAPTAPPSAGCGRIVGFRSVSVRGRDDGRLRLGFEPGNQRPVTVDVFQESLGRRVVRENLVARFRGKLSSFTWDGEANRAGDAVRDGFYMVRYRMALGRGASDTRRVVLQRVNGRFFRRPPFYRRTSCRLLNSFKLFRPVFGGTRGEPLYIAYRVARKSRVTVEVLRRGRVVERFPTRTRRRGRRHRLAFPAGGRPRGDYRVRITVVPRRGKTVRAVLTSRRL